MSRDRIEFEVEAGLEDAFDACYCAAETKRWAVKSDPPYRLQLRQGRGAVTWAVNLDVNLAPSTEEQTQVRVDGRVGGLGPLQRRGLREALNSLQSEILRIVIRDSDGESIQDGPAAKLEALKTLGELREQGVVTEEEFAEQKAKLLRSD